MCALAAQCGLTMWSADISKAFLRGLTFAQLAHRTGEPLRSVQFDVPRGSVPLLSKVPGFECFDLVLECLDMIKPVIGTVYAPLGWHIPLDDALRLAGLTPTQADPQVYVKHRNQRLVQIVSTHVDDLKGADRAPPSGGSSGAATAQTLQSPSGDEERRTTAKFCFKP